MSSWRNPIAGRCHSVAGAHDKCERKPDDESNCGIPSNYRQEKCQGRRGTVGQRTTFAKLWLCASMLVRDRSQEPGGVGRSPREPKEQRTSCPFALDICCRRGSA